MRKSCQTVITTDHKFHRKQYKPYTPYHTDTTPAPAPAPATTALCTLHSALCTLHSAHNTHYTHCTHHTLCTTLHSTLYTLHSTLLHYYTPHLHNLHTSHHTPHTTLFMVFRLIGGFSTISQAGFSNFSILFGCLSNSNPNSENVAKRCFV